MKQVAWLDVIAAFTLYFALQWIGGFVGMQFSQEATRAGASVGLFLGVIFLLVIARVHFSWREFFVGLGALVLIYPLTIGAAYLAGEFFSVFVLPIEGEQMAVQSFRQASGDFPEIALLVLSAALLAPVGEEILFRGLFQGKLRDYFSLPTTLCIVGLCFGLTHMHPEQGTKNVEILAGLFTFSLLVGWLYEKRKSLSAPIGTHVGFNLIGLLNIL